MTGLHSCTKSTWYAFFSDNYCTNTCHYTIIFIFFLSCSHTNTKKHTRKDIYNISQPKELLKKHKTETSTNTISHSLLLYFEFVKRENIFGPTNSNLFFSYQRSFSISESFQRCIYTIFAVRCMLCDNLFFLCNIF